MNLGEVKERVIKLMNEYSNNGVVTPKTSGNYLDYIFRVPDLANDAQMEIASHIKIPAVYSFTQYPIINLLGLHAGFDMEQYLPGTEKIYAGGGAKAYYFEVDRPCTVYIEEEINSVWTELKKIIITDIVKFTGYKGNLTLTGENNCVRMRFTGDYPYVIRNRALFPYNFPSDNDVPTYKAYVAYELPDDYMEFEKVYRWHDQRQYGVMPEEYRLTGRKTIELNWFTNGQFDVHYFKLPEEIDATTSDDHELEIELRAQFLVPYYVAAMIVMDENQAVGTLLLNQYQNKLANLSNLYTINEVGEISDVKGW